MGNQQDNIKKSGTLILVATPIGNLEDITLRALRVLREVDLIAAEDTRRTRKLLSYYNISRKMVSCHAHNEAKRIPVLLDALRAGKDVAVVTDAGSPGISDPGYRLVCHASEQGIPVTAAPGPSAAILSLCLSGLSADRFTFYGFLPRGGKPCRTLLDEAAQLSHTLVFFEAPHRLEKTLERLLAALGDRKTAVCRELTKKFEEIDRGPLSNLLERNCGEKKKRGEFCIVIEGREEEKDNEEETEKRLQQALEALKEYEGDSMKEATKKVAETYGLSRRQVYQAALHLRKSHLEEKS